MSFKADRMSDSMFLVNRAVENGYSLRRCVPLITVMLMAFGFLERRLFNDDSFWRFKLGFPAYYRWYCSIASDISDSFVDDFLGFCDSCFPQEVIDEY